MAVVFTVHRGVFSAMAVVFTVHRGVFSAMAIGRAAVGVVGVLCFTTPGIFSASIGPETIAVTSGKGTRFTYYLAILSLAVKYGYFLNITCFTLCPYFCTSYNITWASDWSLIHQILKTYLLFVYNYSIGPQKVYTETNTLTNIKADPSSGRCQPA